MISLEECRKILGDEARGLSDADLERAREQAHAFAHLLLSIYRDKKAEGVTFPSEEPPTAGRAEVLPTTARLVLVSHEAYEPESCAVGTAPPTPRERLHRWLAAPFLGDNRGTVGGQCRSTLTQKSQQQRPGKSP